ncbi:hypothetical protein AGR7A_Lc120378 [Agrobacterium deltaense NCPPB 1641]|uniref:Uncharacterized protein n=1 Tax=Agrobacterium deltaense NCPPB 1641 TaxID=1183425 RepID=A0A1S7TWV1_9HYPH|nr:hypothetical protein AGR7A_Lc120378 [Agrobacterium deltaense NCPPB 1641]
MIGMPKRVSINILRIFGKRQNTNAF